MGRGFALWVLAIVSVLGAAPRAFSAPPVSAKPGELAKNETVSFTKALETLSRRYHVAFICEDEPHAQTISQSLLNQALSEAASASRDEAAQKEAAQKAVETVAHAFDYQAEQRGGAFLLSKAFTQFPGDLPCITWEECVLMKRDTMRAVRLLNPNIAAPSGTDVPLAAPLMKSLTQDQLAAMFNGSVNIGNTVYGKPRQGVTMDGVPLAGREQKSSKGVVELGLPIRSLSPSQKDEVRKIAAYYFIQSSFGNGDYETPLQQLAKPGVKFRFERTQYEGTPALWTLGGVIPPAAYSDGKKIWSTLWSYYDPTERNVQYPSAQYPVFRQRYYIEGTFPGIHNFGNDEENAAFLKRFEAAAKENNEEAAGKAGLEQARLQRERGVSQTLEQAAKQLNTRPASGSVRVAADAALAQKRVTLIGTNTLDNSSVWAGIARLYGVMTRKLPSGTILLTRYPPQVARTFADVSNALAHVTPLPLVRLAGGAGSDTTMREAAGKEARTRFFALAKQKAAASPDKEFTLDTLGEEGRQYLAIWLSMNEGISLGKRGASLPTYIAEFDDLLLVGGLYIGPNHEIYFSFGFAKEDNPGALIQGPGFGNVPYKP